MFYNLLLKIVYQLCVIKFIIVVSFSILDSPVQLLPKSGLLNNKYCTNTSEHYLGSFSRKGTLQII